MSSGDFSPVSAAIEGVLQPIALIGTAVLLVIVVKRTYQWIRASLDEDEAYTRAFGEDAAGNAPDESDDEYFDDLLLLICRDCERQYRGSAGEDEGSECPDCGSRLEAV